MQLFSNNWILLSTFWIYCNLLTSYYPQLTQPVLYYMSYITRCDQQGRNVICVTHNALQTWKTIKCLSGVYKIYIVNSMLALSRTVNKIRLWKTYWLSLLGNVEKHFQIVNIVQSTAGKMYWVIHCWEKVLGNNCTTSTRGTTHNVAWLATWWHVSR